VFPSRDGDGDVDVARYATKEDALVGHQNMCTKWAER
jgi:hypothetical protein